MIGDDLFSVLLYTMLGLALAGSYSMIGDTRFRMEAENADQEARLNTEKAGTHFGSAPREH